MNAASFRERGPKRNPNDTIEEESRNKVRELLHGDMFSVSDGPRLDKGIDLLVSLKSPNRDLGTGFVVQMKSTEKASKGKFQSTKIETSNLEYLLDNAQPGIYILYVRETQSFYYEWAVDFAQALGLTKSTWSKQKTNSLKFKKTIPRTRPSTLNMSKALVSP